MLFSILEVKSLFLGIGVDKVIRYFCTGFDINYAFGHGLGDMFKSELIILY